MLGYNLAKQGRHEEAIVHLRESIRVCPSALDPHFALAELFRLRSQEEEAIRELRLIVALDPASIDGHYQLGLALARVGRFRGAAAQFEKVLVDAPDHISARYNLAIAFLKRGETIRAVPHLERILERRPDAATHHALGLALYESDLEAALKHLAEAVRLAPDVARYKLNLARALESRRQGFAKRK